MTTQTLENGLIIETLVEGTGKIVEKGDGIKAHYEGSLLDGSVFDSSYKRGEPFTARIGVGQLIKGWDIAVPGMKEGGKVKLTIPAELAYGDMDIPGIPAGSTLVFLLEVLEVFKAKN